jgi:hypothetical protein
MSQQSAIANDLMGSDPDRLTWAFAELEKQGFL